MVQQLTEYLYPLLHIHYITSTVLSTLCLLLQLILETTEQKGFYYYHSLDEEETKALGGSLIQG